MDFMEILSELKSGVEKAAEEQGGTDVLIKNVIANITGQTQEIQKVKKKSFADSWGERVCCIKQYRKLKNMNNSKEASVSDKPKTKNSKTKKPKTKKPKTNKPESDKSEVFENPLSIDGDGEKQVVELDKEFWGGSIEGKGIEKDEIRGYVIIHFILAVFAIGGVTWGFPAAWRVVRRIPIIVRGVSCI